MGETGVGNNHSPENCPGLAELRETLKGNRNLWLAQREWLSDQFAGARRELEGGLTALQSAVEDVRKMSLIGDRDIVEQRRTNGHHSEERWKDVFSRLGRIERHLSMQWILVVMLGLLGLGRGFAWLYNLIAPMLGGSP